MGTCTCPEFSIEASLTISAIKVKTIMLLQGIPLEDYPQGNST